MNDRERSFGIGRRHPRQIACIGCRGHRVQSTVERGGDARRVRLRELGPRACEQLIDGRLPEPQPSLEVTPAERDLGVDNRVWAKRPT